MGWVVNATSRPLYSRESGQLKCDGTRPETTFRLSAKRRSPFKSARASVQSTAGSRVVRISVSNAGYTLAPFQNSILQTYRCTRYFYNYIDQYLAPFASFPFTSPHVRHRVPSHFNWTLLVEQSVAPTSRQPRCAHQR